MKSHQRRLTHQSFGQRLLGLFLTLSTISLLLIASGIAVAGGLVLLTYKEYAEQYVEPSEMVFNKPSTGAVILDRNGEVLYEYVDDRAGIRIPIKLEDVSPHLIAATIATEDPTFFQNPGVNFRGLARAGKESLDSFIEGGDALSGTGGSSITQQLIKNIYVPADQRDERSIDRKIRELVYSAEMTKDVSKEQILEWYLNEISYGGIYSGIEAASQGYFGKAAKDLTLGEATFLAGIPQSPGRLDPRSNLDAAMERREQVISLMERAAIIDVGTNLSYVVLPEELKAAREQELTFVDRETTIRAPHFVLTYLAPQLEQMFGKEALLHDGLVITTTLDLDLQERANAVLNRWVDEFENISNTHNGATVVIEPATGEVLVMLGSRDYNREDIDGAVNNLIMPNSPGSTFKPFVYLTTFVEKGWTPETIILDAPTSFREANGTFFSPTNPGGGYHGPITVRNSLGNSLNIPAFKAAVEVGVEPIVAMARRLGFTDVDGVYGPSIALGGVDFKAFDLAYAYSVLANGGFMAGQDSLAPESVDERLVEPVSILKVVDAEGNVRFDIDDHRVREQVVAPEKAAMVADILMDPGARCITFGCGGLAIPGHRAGVKTGTSEPFDPAGPNAGKIGETWAFGFTPDIVVGVWAGNADNAPIDNIFSTSISYRAMRDILLETYKGSSPSAAQQP